MVLKWFVLFLLINVSFSLSVNESSVNCSLPVDWSDINTTNYTELDILFEQCLVQASEYEDCPDPSVCEKSNSGDENVGLAFGLTIAAGLATTIGSLVPFIPCVKRADTKYLAVSLSLAAGVMLYVSFVEIFVKSQDQFCCVSITHQNLLTTICFFVGILLTVGLDLLVKLLEKVQINCCCKWTFSFPVPRRPPNAIILESHSRTPSCTNHLSAISPLATASSNGGVVQFDENLPIEHMSSHLDNEGNAFNSNTHDLSLSERNDFIPALPGDLDNEHNMAYTPNTERASISAASNTISATTNNLGDASIQDLLSNTSIHRLHAVMAAESVSVMNEDQSHVSISLNEDGISRTQSLPNGDGQSRVSGQPLPSAQPRRNLDEDGIEGGGDSIERASGVLQTEEREIPSIAEGTSERGPDDTEQFREVTNVLLGDSKKLQRMGVLTGLAIALHNFPEGLATFIATLSDPSLGAALTIAIALHNIPEGICVSMPIYYATGSKLKAFFWAFLSGISEPIGALLGWVVLRNFFGPIVYGISFGIIAGMMVYISLKELLPMAQKFDKTNGILVTLFLVIGMIIMALSLVLFYY